MTVKHVAWLSFKEGVSKDRIRAHMDACRALANRVPAVEDLQCGESFTDRAGGLTHCIIVTLASRDAIPAYLDHPAHVPVAEALKRDVADLKVMDVEV